MKISVIWQSHILRKVKKKYKVLIHLFYWFYILNQYLFPIYINKIDTYYFKDLPLQLMNNLVCFYSVYFLLPWFYTMKHKWLSIAAGLGLLSVISFFRFGSEWSYWTYLFPMPSGEDSNLKIWFFNCVRMAFITSIYAVLIKFVIDWFDAQKLKAELLHQNQASELALLRSQINPHFLFNTLNNIYSLVYKKSDEAPEAVMMLSSIMRYMLYDANTDQVLLEKEVEYLKSFAELQKLRLKAKDFVEINIHGDISDKTIAPMLLIAFVENAFKHGSRNVKSPGIIIHLDICDRELKFSIQNFCRKGEHAVKDHVGGIGLSNIRRRLELLYPGKHELVITRNEDVFIILLTLVTS